AIQYVRQANKIKVPPHIASATHPKAGQLLGKGKGYKYPPNYGGYVKQNYMPEGMEGQKFYENSLRGYEKKIAEFMEEINKGEG
ncbi:MAG: replication-associated recombination protein A, partial [Syntrophomonadaceae bacterium]|nr:replication-associated recombination protein A [Syntrophomonadaceae bacterium]